MLEKFSKDCCDNVKANAGITLPWEQILEIVLSLIDDCFASKADFIKSAKNPTILQRAVLNVRLRKELGLSGRYAVNAVSDNIFNTYKDYTEEQLGAGFVEAKVALQPIDYIMG